MTMKTKITDAEALAFHQLGGKPGKLEVVPTKPMTTQRDLSLAYSPGVAIPCLEIEKDPSKSYDYTARGNMVAVISNGTAVLGLGDLFRFDKFADTLVLILIFQAVVICFSRLRGGAGGFGRHYEACKLASRQPTVAIGHP